MDAKDVTKHVHLSDAYRQLQAAVKSLTDAGEPMLAMRVSAVLRELK